MWSSLRTTAQRGGKRAESKLKGRADGNNALSSGKTKGRGRVQRLKKGRGVAKGDVQDI